MSTYDQPSDPGPIGSVEDPIEDECPISLEQIVAGDVARVQQHLATAHDYVRCLVAHEILDGPSERGNSWRAVEAAIRAARAILDASSMVGAKCRWLAEATAAAAEGDDRRVRQMLTLAGVRP